MVEILLVLSISTKQRLKVSPIKRHEFHGDVVIYTRKLKQQVVAESGNPNDEYHFGKLILTCMLSNPNSINQIDGNTGEMKTNATVVRQSKELSQALRTWGLKPGNPIALMTPLHLNAYMPVYAGLYLGAPVQPIDGSLKLQDLKTVLNIGKARVIFCLSEKVKDTRQALKEMNHQSTIISFDKRHPEADFFYDEFVETYGKGYELFQLVPESEDNIAIIMPTSGSTGVQKGVMISQRNFVAQLLMLGTQLNAKIDTELQGAIVMNVSGLYWVTAFFLRFGSLIYKMPLLCTSAELTPSHIADIVNKYKPSFTFMSPSVASILFKLSEQGLCDISCLKNINIGGNFVPDSLCASLRSAVTNGTVSIVYGLSEIGYLSIPNANPNSSSIAKANFLYEYRFVDPTTGAEVGPNNTGELWLKGPTVTKGYYNDAESTREAFSEDGWFKTGDLVTYNDEGELFYVDRLKMLIKYKNFQISPAELEDVIRSHPSVEDVVVVGVRDDEFGDLPAACIVAKPQSELKAKDVIDLVKNNLSDNKQLRGGVLFMSQLPVLSNGKLDRKQAKQLVLSNALKIIK